MLRNIDSEFGRPDPRQGIRTETYGTSIHPLRGRLKPEKGRAWNETQDVDVKSLEEEIDILPSDESPDLQDIDE